MRSGVRIALDIGARRIGVARCDRDGILAVPEATLDAADAGWIDAVAALVAEYDPIELVVGRPVTLRGTDELAVQAVLIQVAALHERLQTLPIRLVDERLTTAASMRALREAGRSTRTARAVIDAAAAVAILEFALETERRTGAPAGSLV